MKVSPWPRRSVALGGLAAVGSLVTMMGAAALGANPAYADIVSPGSGTTVDTATPVASGTGEADGNTVLVTVQNADGMEVFGCNATVMDGVWACTFTNPVPAGVWTFNAQETSDEPAAVSDTSIANVTLAFTPTATPPMTPPLSAAPDTTATAETDASTGPELAGQDPSAAPAAPEMTIEAIVPGGAQTTTPDNALPVTPASDPMPYVMSGLALLTVGAAALLWRVRVRRANRD
jgi:hypothetical protein